MMFQLCYCHLILDIELVAITSTPSANCIRISLSAAHVLIDTSNRRLTAFDLNDLMGPPFRESSYRSRIQMQYCNWKVNGGRGYGGSLSLPTWLAFSPKRRDVGKPVLDPGHEDILTGNWPLHLVCSVSSRPFSFLC